MSTRKNSKKKKLTQHDRKVLEIAKAYKNKDWNVRADLPGYKKPNPIGRSKRIPDVQATKRGATRLFEVETPRSSAQDRNQRRTFKRYVAKKPRTTFTTVKAHRSKSYRKKNVNN